MARLGLAFGLLSTILFAYVRIRFVFESGNLAGFLVLMVIVLGLLAIICGLVGLPRFESWIGLGLGAAVTLAISFSGPIYVIPSHANY